MSFTDSADPNAVGSSADIQNRVLALMPPRWWQWLAPIQGWILGGLSNTAAWSYSWIQYAARQARINTSTGPFLDIIAYDFLGRFLTRQGASDALFKTQITSTILQERVTRGGMGQVLTNLLNIPPVIIEPWNPGDCGGWSGPNQTVGTIAYGRAGAWGSLELPNQSFIRISRSGLGPSGVPLVTGYGGYAGGYQGQGANTLYTQTLSSSSSGWSNRNLRTLIPASSFVNGVGGTSISVSIKLASGTTTDTRVVGWIGPAGGIDPNFDDSQVRLTFNGANSLTTVGPGTYQSDFVLFPFNPADDRIVALFFYGTTVNLSSASGGSSWSSAGPDTSSLTSAGAMSTVANYLAIPQITLGGTFSTDEGAAQYIGSEIAEIGVIDAAIYQMINITRPTGTIVWVNID